MVRKINSKTKKKIEKYYICPSCATLITETEILNECEEGGNGLCDCDFITHYFDETGFDIETSRIYHKYLRISKPIYNYLKTIKNDVKRLETFFSVPINKRL
jgi:ATP-dependent helicase/DNAse subunit B